MTRSHSRSSAYSPLRVLVYSDNARTRERVTQSLGTRPMREGIPPIEFIEAGTVAAVLTHATAGGVDVFILDGEASPVGGLGLAKQLRDEALQCPLVAVLIGRAADEWLARWSRADAVVPHPIDPVVMAEAMMPLLRSRIIA